MGFAHHRFFFYYLLQYFPPVRGIILRSGSVGADPNALSPQPHRSPHRSVIWARRVYAGAGQRRRVPAAQQSSAIDVGPGAGGLDRPVVP